VLVLMLFIAIARLYLIPCILGQHQKEIIFTYLAFLAYTWHLQASTLRNLYSSG
jgi:hypothetical protein